MSDKSFDRGGSWAMGLTEQAVWPEINMANVNFSHGMHVNIVFENSDPKMSRFVLAELGMPFVRPEENSKKVKVADVDLEDTVMGAQEATGSASAAALAAGIASSTRSA